MTASNSQQATGPGPADPSSTPDAGEPGGTARDPYARRRDDWPGVIVDPDYAVPAPRR